MYRLWSEWDIGEGYLIFTSKDAGMRWLRENPAIAEIAQEDNCSIDDCIVSCFDEGFFNWETLEIIQ
jgi:hypothetical protein